MRTQADSITPWWRVVCAACALAALSVGADAGSAQKWETRVTLRGLVGVSGVGTVVGVSPGRQDGYDHDGSPDVQPSDVMVCVLVYHKASSVWTGPTGFYAEDYRSAIPPGGSKTWWDFYLWAQNWTLDPPGTVQVRTTYEDASVRPPDGYLGHLVLDFVPASCNWTGPTEFWLDLTLRNTITLPAATVTDPLDGTRFHLTVYAPPVPEPASLLALATLSLLTGGALVRKRKRGK